MSARAELWYLNNLEIFSHLRVEDHREQGQHTSMREIKLGDSGDGTAAKIRRTRLIFN